MQLDTDALNQATKEFDKVLKNIKYNVKRENQSIRVSITDKQNGDVYSKVLTDKQVEESSDLKQFMGGQALIYAMHQMIIAPIIDNMTYSLQDHLLQINFSIKIVHKYQKVTFRCQIKDVEKIVEKKGFMEKKFFLQWDTKNAEYFQISGQQITHKTGGCHTLISQKALPKNSTTKISFRINNQINGRYMYLGVIHAEGKNKSKITGQRKFQLGHQNVCFAQEKGGQVLLEGKCIAEQKEKFFVQIGTKLIMEVNLDLLFFKLVNKDGDIVENKFPSSWKGAQIYPYVTMNSQNDSVSVVVE